MTERDRIDPLGATEASGDTPSASATLPRSGAALGATLGSTPEFAARLDLSALPQGVAVGRYVVLERAGQGAIGVVYKAYDRELDRFVAIKLLRIRSRKTEDNDETRVRLLREAQALARLDHPNVVSVYDVGIHGRDVFLAMAYVEGTTLSAWLDKEPRSANRILEVFFAAGEGLAAAHRAGLVHRDFKPDNVLVGNDGLVRVLDFGLARPVERPDTSSPDLTVGASFGNSSSGSLPLHSDLTQMGARVGTPLYMAPEQHLGRSVDARADQFAFCVALHEALYRQHPFDAGGDMRDLVTAVTSGRARPFPRGVSLPSGVASVLNRGLAREPADRFASMDELLAALKRRAARRLPFVLATLATVGVAATAGAMTYARYERGTVCAGAEAKLAGVWDDARRRALSEAFRATGLPAADDAFQRTAAALDAYTRDWIAMRTGACEATNVRHEQSAELLDLRVECLDERLEEVRAQVDVFVHPDAATLDKAPQAARALPRLQACADAADLRAPIRPPDDPAARARVAAVRSEIAHAKALQRAGSYEAATTSATRAVDEATALAYRPVEAEALFVLGDLQDDVGTYALAEQTLRRSVAAAIAGGHEAQAARSLTAIVAEEGLRQARFDAAHDWALLAQAETDRTSDAFVKGELLRNVGRVFIREAKYEDARASTEKCLALWEPALGHRS